MDDTDRSEPLLRHLSTRDRELFWLFGKGPRRAVPHPAIHHAIEAMAAAHPAVTAVEHGGDTLTYRELDDRATHLAARLTEHGVHPGDHVALFLRRSIPMVVGILATLKAGAAYVPQDVAIAPPAQLRHVLATARPRVVLTTTEHAPRIPGGHPILTIDHARVPVVPTARLPHGAPTGTAPRLPADTPAPPIRAVDVPVPPGCGVDVLASPGRGVGVLAPPGRGVDVLASPGRGVDVPAPPGRGVDVPASPGRAVGVPAPPGRADDVPASPGCAVGVPAPPGCGVDVLASPGRAVDAPAPPSRAVDAADPCYVLFTSGTTGMPNGVVVTHGNVVNLLLTQPGDLGIQPGWRVGQLLNIAFDMAAWEILGCLSHGGTLVIRGDDIAATARDLDVVIATPTVLTRLDPADCPRVKVVAVAGEPCPRPLADSWAARATFYNGCGPTEVTIVNTMRRHHPGAPLTIGRPTPNNTVYVLDAHGRPCPPGEPGEMWAGGDCVSAGYLDNPDLTRDRYRPDPFLGGEHLMFRTRDLGRWTPEGDLEHLGRTDDQVKIRGFRVELDSVSAVLESLPGCTRAVTLKLDDDHLVSFAAGPAVDPDEARWAVSRALPYYCVPAEVFALDTLPQTPRGKIDKATLLDLARAAEAIA